MKVVIAIDSLKGSLSSIEAGNAAKEGILKAQDAARVIVKPLADGGEGTTDALVEGLGGMYVSTLTAGPMGNMVTAKYGILTEPGAPEQLTCAATIEQRTEQKIEQSQIVEQDTDKRHYLKANTEQNQTVEQDTDKRQYTKSKIEQSQTTEQQDIRFEFLEKKDSDQKTAVIEMAQAAGITLIDRKSLNPWKAATTGVGEMILDALHRGCRKYIIGIGGSATTEGGIGMLQALGYEFFDASGCLLPPEFASLGKIEKISSRHVPAELLECSFQIACDVTNPLCGTNGAVFVYGPQKGVKPEEKETMDSAMKHYARKTAEFTGRDYSLMPGAGAAGGMGFAFQSYLPHVELKSGAEIVLEAVGLERELADADFVVTGEGCLDAQTAMGKVPIAVAHLAKKYGCRVLAFAGSVTDDAQRCNSEGIDAFFPIVRGVTSLEQAMEADTARKNMSQCAEQVFRLL